MYFYRVIGSWIKCIYILESRFGEVPIFIPARFFFFSQPFPNALYLYGGFLFAARTWNETLREQTERCLKGSVKYKPEFFRSQQNCLKKEKRMVYFHIHVPVFFLFTHFRQIGNFFLFLFQFISIVHKFLHLLAAVSLLMVRKNGTNHGDESRL